MSSDFKIFWTETALQDLRSIKEYIASDSSEQAEIWILELFAVAESLVNLPARGRIVPELNQENMRELLIDNYRLVYRIKKKSVEVLTIFEGHRLLKKKDLKK